jgi:hypothetical protein
MFSMILCTVKAHWPSANTSPHLKSATLFSLEIRALVDIFQQLQLLSELKVCQYCSMWFTSALAHHPNPPALRMFPEITLESGEPWRRRVLCKFITITSFCICKNIHSSFLRTKLFIHVLLSGFPQKNIY